MSNSWLEPNCTPSVNYIVLVSGYRNKSNPHTVKAIKKFYKYDRVV
jgi:hypothetical protein